MALEIRTTGVEDYVDGSANIRLLVIGPPGSGKTRMSSWWPKPIYADCESGRASLADRQMPYTEIKSSQDMLDFLSYCKRLETTPKSEREFQTVVVDTLDGFQRKVVDERLLATKKQSFTSFEDWGYLDAKMQMLMTRLLNLDYNVIVTCHYKDKAVKDGDGDGRELMLQLKGDIKDSAYNDFDLVGWLGTYWAAEGGERVEKRGLSFKRTPDRPFLKDRTGVLPDWVPITLTSEQDFTFIHDALMAKVEGLAAGTFVAEIPSAEPELNPRAVGPVSGPLPPQDPRVVSLHQFDKTTLLQICRTEGVTTTIDGAPLRSNSVKAEIIQAIEHARSTKAPESDSESASLTTTPAAPADSTAEPVVATASEPAADAKLVATPVDTSTGEIAPTKPAGAVKTVPVAQVLSVPPAADTTSVADDKTPGNGQAPLATTCQHEGCNIRLATQNISYVRLAEQRFGRQLCGTHYAAASQAHAAR